jgi:two-component system sensor histidine kinase PilS (NtrC family)
MLPLSDAAHNPVIGPPSEDLWRSLHYFNLYRMALASLFVFLAGAFGPEMPLGTGALKIFFVASLVYAAVVAASFVTLRLRRLRLNWQLAMMVVGDIVCLSVLSNASGGIQSNVSLLLLVSLAAAGMISRGKITLLFASLTSIAALLEHSYAVLYDDADTAQYIQVGLLCMSYFAVAWLAHTLAKYAVDSQLLAQRRSRELVNLAEANRLVMRDMQDGILVVDGAGKILQMNQRAERLLRNTTSVGGAMLEIFPVLYRQYRSWMSTGSSRRDTLELDGGVQARLRFVAIDHDPASGVVIFLEDMQRMRAEAQQIKLAALGRLTANIAHEVRNPLSAISYATELLREEHGDDKQQRLLQIVMDNTRRINQIVQDVMQLNRRDRAQVELLDLDRLLHAFTEEFCLAEQINSEVISLTGATGLDVLFDRGHLRQVLWNLCRNALRYGRRVAGSLRLTAGEEEGRTILDVQDDGPGIVVEQQGKLFEPFFTTATDGTGLGLYIARELCEANGARLEYRAEGGGLPGACFRITFCERDDSREM